MEEKHFNLTNGTKKKRAAVSFVNRRFTVCTAPHITGFVRSSRMRWTLHAARTGKTHVLHILIGWKHLGKPTADKRIVLKWSLKKCGVRLQEDRGSCKHDSECLGFTRSTKSLEQLSGNQLLKLVSVPSYESRVVIPSVIQTWRLMSETLLMTCGGGGCPRTAVHHYGTNLC